jgi:hypothetical protein
MPGEEKVQDDEDGEGAILARGVNHERHPLLEMHPDLVGVHCMVFQILDAILKSLLHVKLQMARDH